LAPGLGKSPRGHFYCPRGFLVRTFRRLKCEPVDIADLLYAPDSGAKVDIAGLPRWAHLRHAGMSLHVGATGNLTPVVTVSGQHPRTISLPPILAVES